MLISDTSQTPTRIVTDNNWLLVTDDAVLEAVCAKVVSSNEKAVSKF
jgi:Asp-tRNA(Asn)/Glu-tRNA(Gln) amidotransferase B subunit